MILSEVAAGLSVFGLIFTDNIFLIYGMLAIQAVFVSLMIPARQAGLPALVEENELTQTNAFFQQLSGVVKIIAPMLAGFVLTVSDAAPGHSPGCSILWNFGADPQPPACSPTADNCRYCTGKRSRERCREG